MTTFGASKSLRYSQCVMCPPTGSPLKSNSMSSSLPCNRGGGERARGGGGAVGRGGAGWGGVGRGHTHEAAGVVVARGGGVAEGLEQRAGGRQRAAARAAAARHHGALQAHARRLRLARAALA